MFSNADLVHLHFLLNHFPTVGLLVGLGLFVVGLFGRSSDLKRGSLATFVVIALIGLPTYVSGNIAGFAIEKQPGVSKTMIETHEGMALVSLAVMMLLGAVAWLGLWQHRRFARIPSATLGLVLVLGLVTFGLMAKTAELGGEIKHPEIKVEQSETTTVLGPFARNVSLGFKSLTWAWAAAETLHFLGLCLIMGVTLLLDLRMLGMMKSVPFAALHRLLPWGILGFLVNTVTGMVFFASSPGQYVMTAANAELFLLKMVFIVIAGLNALYFTVLDEAWLIRAGEDAPGRTKAIAASAIFLWLAVIYCGSMLPFIGGAF